MLLGWWTEFGDTFVLTPVEFLTFCRFFFLVYTLGATVLKKAGRLQQRQTDNQAGGIEEDDDYNESTMLYRMC